MNIEGYGGHINSDVMAMARLLCEASVITKLEINNNATNESLCGLVTARAINLSRKLSAAEGKA